MSNIVLELIVPTESQIEVLYDLLKVRQHNISHVSLPSYGEHSDFVLNNPYRCWYLICLESEVLGSVYVQFDNSVGIRFGREPRSDDLGLVIDSLRSLVQPLEPIASLRYRDFFFNVSCSDKNLQCCLEEIGYTPSQVSFVQSKAG